MSAGADDCKTTTIVFGFLKHSVTGKRAVVFLAYEDEPTTDGLTQELDGIVDEQGYVEIQNREWVTRNIDTLRDIGDLLLEGADLAEGALN